MASQPTTPNVPPRITTSKLGIYLNPLIITSSSIMASQPIPNLPAPPNEPPPRNSRPYQGLTNHWFSL